MCTFMILVPIITSGLPRPHSCAPAPVPAPRSPCRGPPRAARGGRRCGRAGRGGRRPCRAVGLVGLAGVLAALGFVPGPLGRGHVLPRVCCLAPPPGSASRRPAPLSACPSPSCPAPPLVLAPRRPAPGLLCLGGCPCWRCPPGTRPATPPACPSMFLSVMSSAVMVTFLACGVSCPFAGPWPPW
jgi:hypothetical protein